MSPETEKTIKDLRDAVDRAVRYIGKRDQLIDELSEALAWAHPQIPAGTHIPEHLLPMFGMAMGNQIERRNRLVRINEVIEFPKRN